MSEIVVLPREVADEVKEYRNLGWTDYHIISYIYKQFERGDAYSPMAAFAYQHPSPFLRALTEGFEVEQTPEDKVREYYAGLDQQVRKRMEEMKTNTYKSHETCEMVGIVQTLNLLNIKIDGVNA